MGAVLVAPVKGNDVGKLQPVQAVMASKERNQVVIQTDTGDRGEGKDVLAALENLKATTPATIYLDTAQYLLVTEDALEEVEALRGVLKKNVRICLAQGDVLEKDTARFLRVHGQLPQLKTWKVGQELPLLTTFEKRLIFSKNKENKA